MLFSKGSYARAEALVDTVKSSDTFRVEVSTRGPARIDKEKA